MQFCGFSYIQKCLILMMPGLFRISHFLQKGSIAKTVMIEPTNTHKVPVIVPCSGQDFCS